jgi:hypothetical protein
MPADVLRNLTAFVRALNQFPARYGEKGLLPVPRFLAAVPLRRAPSLFFRHYSDRFARAVAVARADSLAGQCLPSRFHRSRRRNVGGDRRGRGDGLG